MKYIKRILNCVCFFLITACSTGGGYNFVQENFRDDECQSLPSSSFAKNECVDKYNEPYEYYERNRGEVVEKNK